MKKPNGRFSLMIFLTVSALILLIGYSGDSIAHLDTDGDRQLSYEEASKTPFIDKETFDCLDKSGDGYLDQEEFPPPPRPGARGSRTEQETAESGRDSNAKGRPQRPALDIDGDGSLTYEEASKLPFINEDTFDCFDKNGDGVLSQEELPSPQPPGHHGQRFGSGQEQEMR
ncbi:MAG: hypothetical protein HY801_00110 [Candidatus Lindowbacteria bacterium]|nr:hypothetical protein [Candidatus Lindowbacteria bacterium]